MLEQVTHEVCGAAALPVRYGYPGEQMIHQWEAGLIHVGGCLVYAEMPGWFCPVCRVAFDVPHRPIPDGTRLVR